MRERERLNFNPNQKVKMKKGKKVTDISDKETFNKKRLFCI